MSECERVCIYVYVPSNTLVARVGKKYLVTVGQASLPSSLPPRRAILKGNIKPAVWEQLHQHIPVRCCSLHMDDPVECLQRLTYKIAQVNYQTTSGAKEVNKMPDSGAMHLGILKYLTN